MAKDALSLLEVIRGILIYLALEKADDAQLRTLEERLRLEAEMTLSMFMRRDSHTIGAGAFKRGERPEWPHHGL